MTQKLSFSEFLFDITFYYNKLLIIFLLEWKLLEELLEEKTPGMKVRCHLFL